MILPITLTLSYVCILLMNRNTLGVESAKFPPAIRLKRNASALAGLIFERHHLTAKRAR